MGGGGVILCRATPPNVSKRVGGLDALGSNELETLETQSYSTNDVRNT